MPPSPYEKLESRFRRLLTLADAQAFLHWDMATMMPSGGAASRGDQLAEMAAVQHGLLTDPEIGDLILAAGGLKSEQAANLAEMRRMWNHATALTEDLVLALSKAASSCETVWRGARAEGDFAAVQGPLSHLLTLVREAAAAKAEKLGLSPYDALLDEYEPDGRGEDIDAVFGDLEAFLPPFLGQVREHQSSRPPVVMPEGPFPVAAQRALGVGLMTSLGFDFDHGRLDVSLHPFCGGSAEDVRITTRYDESDFTSSLMAVLHETGHALYDRGLPRAWRGQPAGQARSMSMHESQSLLIEMQACRSRPFLAFATPLMGQAFGGSGPAWEMDNLHRLYTRVEPGFIRVDADEVTYPLHVILRYRLERAMIAGDLAVADLPGAWNEGFKRLLDLTPPTDREGCLQDIHWFDGAWGYFPTYTLGAMTAAQIFQAATTARPDILPAIGKGDFAPLFAWLGENIHGRGSLASTRDILIGATGKPLDSQAFKSHLRHRYLES
jgi:carboxypeptidase Taq